MEFTLHPYNLSQWPHTHEEEKGRLDGSTRCSDVQCAVALDEPGMWSMLPDEIWQMIISLLNQADIPRVSLVCRRFATLSATHMRFLLIIRQPTYLTDDVLRRVAWLRPRRLALVGTGNLCSNQSLALLNVLDTLKELWIQGGVDDAAVPVLGAAVPHLRGLHLKSARDVTDRGLTNLVSAFRELGTLVLGNCFRMTDAGVLRLTALTHLRALSLQYTPRLSKQGVASLTHALSGLTALNLNAFCNTNDLSMCSGLYNLKSLNMGDCLSITNVSHLSGLYSLQNLILNDCFQVMDASPVSGLHEMRQLSLRGCMISDLSPLSGLHQLKALDLGDCARISDLSPLASLRALTAMDLSRCTNLSDLSALCGLPDLRVLNLRGCKGITTAAVDRLTTLTPGLRVGVPDNGKNES